jgi:hypothetical protein
MRAITSYEGGSAKAVFPCSLDPRSDVHVWPLPGLKNANAPANRWRHASDELEHGNSGLECADRRALSGMPRPFIAPGFIIVGMRRRLGCGPPCVLLRRRCHGNDDHFSPLDRHCCGAVDRHQSRRRLALVRDRTWHHCPDEGNRWARDARPGRRAINRAGSRR